MFLEKLNKIVRGQIKNKLCSILLMVYINDLAPSHLAEEPALEVQQIPAFTEEKKELVNAEDNNPTSTETPITPPLVDTAPLTTTDEHAINRPFMESQNDYYNQLALYNLEKALCETIWNPDNDGDPDIEKARIKRTLLIEAKKTLETKIKALTPAQKHLINLINYGEINPDNFKLSKLDPVVLDIMLNDPEGISYTFARLFSRILDKISGKKEKPESLTQAFVHMLDKVLGHPPAKPDHSIITSAKKQLPKPKPQLPYQSQLPLKHSAQKIFP